MFIGIDFGTSEVKVLLMNGNGEVLASAGSRLSISRPHPMWSEQNPIDWWNAMVSAMHELDRKMPKAYQQVKSIGLSGQMHGAVLLDAAGEVLRPAILWNDMRSHKECAQLNNLVPNLSEITGNLAMPGFTAPKLLWVKTNEVEVFNKTQTVLLPKDFIRKCLTGDLVSDMSDAAGTLWVDVGKRDWSEVMLNACGLTRKHMPKLIEGSDCSGTLLTEVARLLNLPEGIIVAGGAGDNAASAVGIGAVNDGDGFISLGTSGVLFVVDNSYRPKPEKAVHTFCHALPNRWHHMAVMLSAASNLRWFCQMNGVSELELLREIEEREVDANAPIFLPYLSGERTPHNDPYAQGVFMGITHDTKRADMGYAVLEGGAFGLLDGLSVLRDSGVSVSELSIVGGGARSGYWAQLIADVLQVTIHTHVGGEAGGALGAARLAALAFGLNEEQVCFKPAISYSYCADPDRKPFLQTRFTQFREIYQSLKPIFSRSV